MYLSHGSPELFLRVTQALDLAIRADLKDLRDWYFDCLLVCTAVVGIGLFMEGPEIVHDLYGIFVRPSIELKYWLAPSMHRREYRVPDWMKVLTAVGWLLIVLGVMGEGISEGYVSRADGTLQTFNDILLSDARKEAAFAIERSAGAYERAAKTEREAAEENNRAAQALTAAEEARKSAEGFQLQIAQANERAAHAEQRAAEAALELTRLRSPRSLIHVPGLVSALKKFKDTEYTFSGVFQDEDSGNLVRAIDDILQRSGWKRVKPVHHFPMLTFSNKGGTDFEVPAIFSTGIQVSVDSSESPEALNVLPLDKLPPPVRAAVVLNLGLLSSLFPPQETGKKEVNVETGTSTAVRIAVGKKP